MPSGRTHDRITLWSLPWVGGATLVLTQSSRLTLIVVGGFLLGGLMFGPDLDIYSRQYQRWGWLKWMWLPYRKMLKHRSFWSHGFVVGTTLRLLYFTVCLGLAVGLGLGFIQVLLGLMDPEGRSLVDWTALLFKIQQGFQQYPIEWLTFYAGLEVGAMSHSCSDWLGSSYKQLKRQGVKGWLRSPKKPKKRPRKRKPANSNPPPRSLAPTKRRIQDK
jgi:uncharacterized metal-binding protein